jgi:glucan phosphoethanolaminetransferase (alkaline phosphatase superfamily)
MNNIFIFTIHIIYILSLLLFQGISVLLEPKENFIFNIISILFLIFIVILRTVLVVKNDDKNITMLLNFFSCFCLTFINFIIFVITLKYLKMKKNVQQNIEEIINFTDILQATNSKIGEKKDNQLMLNNSGDIKPEMNNIDNKKGITNLVEESNNNAIGEQQNIEKK